jgi:hypothetical protein
MPQLSDYLFHSGTLGIFILVAWQVTRRLNRDESLKRDYPPHRHVNGSRIMYPEEYQPSKIENLGGD